MRVSVLVLDQVFDSGLAVVLDTFATVNDLARSAGRAAPFEVTVCGMRRTAATQQGWKVALAPPPSKADVIIVPALGCKTRETITAALDRRDVGEATALLRSWSAAGARITGACTATFVLAKSGLLDGGRATTTWWLSP